MLYLWGPTKSFCFQLSLLIVVKLEPFSHYDVYLSNNLHCRISTLQFWFDRLLAIIAAFGRTTTYNPDESELWSAIFVTYQQLKQSIDFVGSRKTPSDSTAAAPASTTEPPATARCTNVLTELVHSRLATNEQLLKQSLANYGSGRLMLQGPLA